MVDIVHLKEPSGTVSPYTQMDEMDNISAEISKDENIFFIIYTSFSIKYNCEIVNNLSICFVTLLLC